MKEVRGFIFDNDGVVIDTEKELVRINTILLAELGVEFKPELRKRFTGKPNIEGLEILIDLHGLKGKVIAQELARRRDPMLVEWYTNVRFIPEFKTYFNKLKKEFPTANFAVASGTNPEFYEIADKKLGLRKMFHGNICLSKDTVKNHKPSPDIFVYTAGYIHTPVEDCTVWEDSPLGIVAALHAGVRKVIGYTGTLNQEDLTEASEELLGRRLEVGKEVFFIEDYTLKSLRQSIAFLRK